MLQWFSQVIEGFFPCDRQLYTRSKKKKKLLRNGFMDTTKGLRCWPGPKIPQISVQRCIPRICRHKPRTMELRPRAFPLGLRVWVRAPSKLGYVHTAAKCCLFSVNMRPISSFPISGFFTIVWTAQFGSSDPKNTICSTSIHGTDSDTYAMVFEASVMSHFVRLVRIDVRHAS